MDGMAQLFMSVKRLKRHKKGNYKFTNIGVAKQAKFITTMEDWVHDELQVRLGAEYRQLLNSLKDIISSYEKLLSERFHSKIADQYGWAALTEFTQVELARNEVAEKKLKKMMQNHGWC